MKTIDHWGDKDIEVTIKESALVRNLGRGSVTIKLDSQETIDSKQLEHAQRNQETSTA